MKGLKLLLIFCMTALNPMPAISASDEAVKHFVKGQMLITSNCGECTDASRRGLEDGLAELKLAISKGHADKEGIYKLMYKAYTDIAFYYSENDPIEVKKSLDLRQQISEKLVALLPEDPDVLERYAEGVQDQNEQLKIWQKVLHLAPKNYSARLMVGVRFVEKGLLEQGLAQLKQAVKDANPDAKGPFMQQALDTLEQYGHKAEADKWRMEVTTQMQQQNIRKPQSNK